MIGTQMITKGLDFENVTLVGVLAADQALYVDDYHAAENTFALITQVVGRAGRGEKEGRKFFRPPRTDAGAGAGVSARAAAGSGAGAGGVFVRSIYLFVLPMAFPSYISRLSCAFSGSAIAPRICVSAMTFCML